MHSKFLIGIWRLTDPKISLASISSIFLGTCAAISAGPIDILWLIVLIAGILCIEAAKNASGDVFDYDSGADLAVADEDRSPFSGGKRVIVDGLLTRHQTIVVAAVFYVLGSLCGLLICVYQEPMILWLGIAGMLLAYFYHAPPLKLSYRGLGEIAVAITYGPLIGCGTYLVFQHQLSSAVVMLSIPLGFLVAAFLVCNEFPDRRADASAGKMNLVVRLSEQHAGWLFMGLSGIAYSNILLLPVGDFSMWVWLGGLGLPFSIAAAARVHTTRQTSAIIPAQRFSLLSFVLAALGLGSGVLL